MADNFLPRLALKKLFLRTGRVLCEWFTLEQKGTH